MATATAKKKPTKAAEAKLKKAVGEMDEVIKAAGYTLHVPAKPKVNPQAKARADKLITALKELGTGKNKIAESLKAKKIRGKMGNSDECPIAIFVKKLFPKSTDITVDSDSIEVGFENPEFDFSVKCPSAVGKFIDEFDGEKFPDLVKSSVQSACG